MSRRFDDAGSRIGRDEYEHLYCMRTATASIVTGAHKDGIALLEENFDRAIVNGARTRRVKGRREIAGGCVTRPEYVFRTCDGAG